VAGSVRHCIASYSLVENDEQAWKWVALSLHSALQGACVCHVVTTFVPVGAVTSKNAGEWIAYMESARSDSEAKPPSIKLLNLPDLLKKVRKPRSAGNAGNSDGGPITDSEMHWLRRFHEQIRNEFTHFSPKGWSIEISGIPALTELIVRIISSIDEIGWAFRHENEAWRSELRSDLRTLANLGSFAGPAA
jgi:hypothetical protein